MSANDNQLSRYGAIARSLPPTLGKIFFVAHGMDSFASDLLSEFPVDKDGVPRVYVTTASSTAPLAAAPIQLALDACVASRNDYVIILPSNYNYILEAQLTMSKRDVHLIGMDYLSNRQDCGSNSATKIKMSANDDAILLTGGNCEIAGLYFNTYNNQASILSTGGVCDCAHIHHNHFNLNGTTTNGVPVIDFSAGSSSFICIERNTFATNVSDLTFSSIVSISASCTWAKVLNNNLICGDHNTWTICILNLSYKGQTNGNTIASISGGGGDTGSIATAVSIGGGIANDNRINTVNTQDYGTAGTYSFLGNWSNAHNEDS